MDKFNYFRSEISFSNGVKPPKVWFTRVHAILNVGIRINNERDHSQGIFLDLASNALRFRWIIKGKAITINLTGGETKYVRERLDEGGRPKLARAWVKDDFLYVAITFERDVELIRPNNYVLAIDVNSWRNGVVWGLIKDNSISSLGRERPWLRRIDKLYNRVLELEKEYGKLRRLGAHKSIKGKKVWREVRILKRKLYAILGIMRRSLRIDSLRRPLIKGLSSLLMT